MNQKSWFRKGLFSFYSQDYGETQLKIHLDGNEWPYFAYFELDV